MSDVETATYAVFRLERFTQVPEFTYLCKHFPCVNANWYFGKCRKRQKTFDQGKSCNYRVIRFGYRLTVGHQGQDDRYMDLWRHHISLRTVSRSCDCHWFYHHGREVGEVRERLERPAYVYGEQSVRLKKALYFSFSVLLTTLSRQTSILCCEMVDVFSHQRGGCCIFTISTFLRGIQPCVSAYEQPPEFSPQIMEWGRRMCTRWHFYLFLLIHCGRILIQVPLMKMYQALCRRREILTFMFAALELRSKKKWPRKPLLHFLKWASF